MVQKLIAIEKKKRISFEELLKWAKANGLKRVRHLAYDHHVVFKFQKGSKTGQITQILSKNKKRYTWKVFRGDKQIAKGNSLTGFRDEMKKK